MFELNGREKTFSLQLSNPLVGVTWLFIRATDVVFRCFFITIVLIRIDCTSCRIRSFEDLFAIRIDCRNPGCSSHKDINSGAFMKVHFVQNWEDSFQMLKECKRFDLVGEISIWLQINGRWCGNANNWDVSFQLMMIVGKYFNHPYMYIYLHMRARSTV